MLPVSYGDTEPANWTGVTVNEMLRKTVARIGDRPALCLKRPEGVRARRAMCAILGLDRHFCTCTKKDAFVCLRSLAFASTNACSCSC
jgi:hypothetical protein